MKLDFISIVCSTFLLLFGAKVSMDSMDSIVPEESAIVSTESIHGATSTISPGGVSTLVDLGPFDGHTIFKCYYSVPIENVPSILFDVGRKYPNDWPAILDELCTADAHFVAVVNDVESTKTDYVEAVKDHATSFYCKENHPVHRKPWRAAYLKAGGRVLPSKTVPTDSEENDSDRELTVSSATAPTDTSTDEGDSDRMLKERRKIAPTAAPSTIAPAVAPSDEDDSDRGIVGSDYDGSQELTKQKTFWERVLFGIFLGGWLLHWARKLFLKFRGSKAPATESSLLPVEEKDAADPKPKEYPPIAVAIVHVFLAITTCAGIATACSWLYYDFTGSK